MFRGIFPPVDIDACQCYTCFNERHKDKDFLFMSRMFLCSECGNKRCPHAAYHLNKCTGSNDPGQPGSLYEDAK